jgi:3-phosphoshikimate 1-carboxyvinyltransferase
MLGSEIVVSNLNPNSLQGDRVYKSYFEELEKGVPTLDISDCPDLGPVLFALAALKNGATFTGTDRLRLKESNRGEAMHQELVKLGGGLLFGDNIITIPKQALHTGGPRLYGHNDHRIVMALSLILSQIGGEIDGAEAVKKSYPDFFTDIKSLKAKVELL